MSTVVDSSDAAPSAPSAADLPTKQEEEKEQPPQATYNAVRSSTMTTATGPITSTPAQIHSTASSQPLASAALPTTAIANTSSSSSVVDPSRRPSQIALQPQLLPSSQVPPTHTHAVPILSLDAEVIRDSLLRELEQAKEENRRYYIASAQRMIEMQEKIDTLTRENIAFIRSLTPQTINNW